MQRGVAILLSLTVTACFTGTVFGANEVLFTMDPDKNVPTMVTETGSAAKKIVFRSANLVDASADPVPFTLVFKDTFAGQYDDTDDKETDADTTTRPGFILFESSLVLDGDTCEYKISNQPPPNGTQRECQWVKMRLKNSPGSNDAGFLYMVEMGSWGQVIDPRIRGK